MCERSRARHMECKPWPPGATALINIRRNKCAMAPDKRSLSVAQRSRLYREEKAAEAAACGLCSARKGSGSNCYGPPFRVLPAFSGCDARLGRTMEVKVFATEDGALVLLPADTEFSDQLMKVGALQPIGDGCVPTASLSPELVTLLSQGSPAMAQPPDVQPVLHAVASRAAS